MQVQLRSDDDHRTARIIDALPEEVLTEPPLLPFQHVGERFQRAVVVAPHGVDPAGVVEERIDRLLQHPLLVAKDDVGGLDVDQALQAVVPDDHPPVQVVEVRRRKPSSFQGDERPELRGNHRDDIEHHPFRPVQRAGLGFPERLDHPEALESVLLFLDRGLLEDLRTKLRCERSDVDLLQEALDRIAADLGDEPPLVRRLEVVVVVGESGKYLEKLLFRDQVLLLESRRPRVDDNIRFVVDDLLEVLRGHPEDVADL